MSSMDMGSMDMGSMDMGSMDMSSTSSVASAVISSISSTGMFAPAGTAPAFMSSTMSSMAMDNTATAAAAAASSSASSMGGMSGMGDMSGMAGMGSSDPHACKVDMLWNWNTVDACFIARSWHVTSPGMFAGSCIGVILLTMSLEVLRRFRRAYDEEITKQFKAARRNRSAGGAMAGAQGGGDFSKGGAVVVGEDGKRSDSEDESSAGKKPRVVAAGEGVGKAVAFRPKLWQQMIRALLHTAQFAVAYFVMLLAMYFNGYIIISILIGAFLGYFVMEYQMSATADGEEEATGCCG